MEDKDTLVVPEVVVSPEVKPAEVKPPEGTVTKPAETKQGADLIQEQLAALTKRLADVEAKSRQEIQSVKDKAINEIKKAKAAEDALKQVRAKVQGRDPELAKEVELEELRAKARGQDTLEKEDAAAQQQAEFHKQFRASMEEALTELGVDLKSDKIDWADDAPNYIEAQKRILKSAGKIKKEQDAASKIELQEQLKKQLKETENKLRKELGLDSVDSTPAGVVSSENATLIDKLASGQPVTADERKRAKKLLGI